MRKISLHKGIIPIVCFTTVMLCGCSSTAKNVVDTTSFAVDGAAVSESTESVTSTTATDASIEETTEETEGETATSAKTIEDLVKEAAKVSDFTEEELESIAEDARVYEAYGSDAETAFDMAMKDAVYGKSNGQQDYAVTLPQVVDENGNPYPTDEYGGVIIPETTAPEETTQVAENETPTATVSEEGKELTYEYTDEQLDYTLKVYGDDEVFVVIENDTGEVHKYGNLTEYRNYVSIRDYEKTQEELAAAGFVEWDGKLNTQEDAAMTDEELRQAIEDGRVHGYVQ